MLAFLTCHKDGVKLRKLLAVAGLVRFSDTAALRFYPLFASF
jgi:hypothetical protein